MPETGEQVPPIALQMLEATDEVDLGRPPRARRRLEVDRRLAGVDFDLVEEVVHGQRARDPAQEVAQGDETVPRVADEEGDGPVRLVLNVLEAVMDASGHEIVRRIRLTGGDKGSVELFQAHAERSD
jgi:hypothetical protein